MLRSKLAYLISTSVENLIDAGELPESVRGLAAEISDTKNPEHGDYSCNFAMVASKKAGMPPRAIGEKLIAQLAGSDLLSGVDMAGPGFLNLRVQPSAISAYVAQILDEGAEFGRTTTGNKQKVNVEFVSVNPNGPITIGSGRGAAFGDALCRVLDAAGFEPYREYYINDGVNSQQMRLFAESVRHYYREAEGIASEMPEAGYKGSYVADVATSVREIHGSGKADESIEWFQHVSQELMIERQRSDLKAFRVDFDRWTSEQALHDSGKVAASLEMLQDRGNTYRALKAETEAAVEAETEAATDAEEVEEEDTSAGEALWLRSSAFGDDKDRVLIRGNGRPAYIAADVAYLDDKFSRGFEKLKLVLGPDHHGYINRLYAASQAIGHTTGRDGAFEIIIYQVVRFVKEGKPARMRKRDGNIYELRDLIDELGADAAPDASREEQLRIGADVARFFFLMRSHDTHMDFDIDLATKQSDENPVFYAQYAHARICSVIAKGEAAGFKAKNDFDLSLLSNPKELQLIKKLLDLSFEVDRSAKDYGVHRLTTYAVELARTYHHFYDACRVIQVEEPETSRARLALCEAAKTVLANTFEMLGVSAPTRMDRHREATAE